jgi:hypothetical protein
MWRPGKSQVGRRDSKLVRAASDWTNGTLTESPRLLDTILARDSACDLDWSSGSSPDNATRALVTDLRMLPADSDSIA